MFRKASVLLATLLPLLLFAQKDKDIPAFGKVTKEELTSKDCDFDKNAEAVVLFDVEELYCVFNPTATVYPLRTEIEKHIRIKILNDKGLSAADVKIPYYSYKNATNIKDLTAQTYNLDDNGNVVITKVDKKSVYDKRIDTKTSNIIFSFPEIKAGTIVEYKYTLEGAGIFGLTARHFQRSIPVAFSRYIVNFPSEIEVHCERFNSLPLDFKKETKASREIQTYTMRSVPALRDEPFITCDKDYVQKVVPKIIAYNAPGRRHSYVYTWPQVIKALMEDEDFGVQLKRNIPRTRDLDDSLKNITDAYTKMKTIHSYVRKNMEWNGYRSIWALEGVKSAWSVKKGTSGEINLILVNLLKDAGLKAHPILVSTKEHGRVNTSVADEQQFDKVLAHVTIGDKFYILDGTDRLTPSGLIPISVMYSEGLVIEKPETLEWGWVPLWDDTKMFRDVIIVNAKLSAEGELAGEATITSFDYSRINRLAKLKEGRDEYLQKTLIGKNLLLVADSMHLTNELHDSLPLIQRIPFKQKLNAEGDYQYFSVNLFTGFETNPFVADTRSSDIFFAANQQYNIVGSYTIPDGYAFEELPKSLKMMTPDTGIVLIRRIASNENQLSARITLEIKKPFFSTEEYEDFREFYKKMVGILNEQFIIKKKAVPKP